MKSVMNIMSLEGTTSLFLCSPCQNLLLLLLLLLLAAKQVMEVERSGVCRENGVKEKYI